MSAWLAIMLAAAAQPAAASPAPVTVKPERVCRESERRTGSRIRTARRCLTEDQWRIEDERRDRVPATLRVTDGQDDAGQKRPQ